MTKVSLANERDHNTTPGNIERIGLDLDQIRDSLSSLPTWIYANVVLRHDLERTMFIGDGNLVKEVILSFDHRPQPFSKPFNLKLALFLIIVQQSSQGLLDQLGSRLVSLRCQPIEASYVTIWQSHCQNRVLWHEASLLGLYTS
ncbi:MAG: hypothetical protein ACRBM6_00565 [Geminicoccales bacterium]